ncbi:hypothetical protein WH47_10883 [Habropoda laboriosa]|uniref:Uncharacterized protein n=1 Tax=Habropoda laboriosa TaxID=597456 RepID=A0A0L7RDM6_9HYME|nr:hypothetical protein WH47_10883 [Habropoda laboriosa]
MRRNRQARVSSISIPNVGLNRSTKTIRREAVTIFRSRGTVRSRTEDVVLCSLSGFPVSSLILKSVIIRAQWS